MAYTQTQLLDAFCRRHSYDSRKQEGETKLQFLNRIERDWAKSQALQQLRDEAQEATESTHSQNASGVTL